MPDLAATCSLDESCPIDQFSDFCDSYPDHTSVVYANTSAEVKARADWVVTSSIATKVIKHLAEKGEEGHGFFSTAEDRIHDRLTTGRLKTGRQAIVL